MRLRPFAPTTGFLLAAALLYCTQLGALDLWAPDEPRYAQVADEMRSMEHGLAGLVLLHLGGEPYTQKPPLYFWLAAGLGGSSGGRVTEALARLPSALAGVSVVLLCLAFGRRLPFARAAGPWAAAILLSTYYFAFLARRAQLDVLLTLFETLALYVFWRTESVGARPNRAAVAALHGAMALAALTKGPVGWLPLLILATYLASEKRIREVRTWCPPWALLLSVGPTLAWVAAATALAPEGYFQHAVVSNVIGRVVDADSHVRPFYYFLYQLPLLFLPATLLAPLSIREGRRAFASGGESKHAWRFLLAWVAVPLVVFSLSSGKRGLYMLPSFPALALLSGASLAVWLCRHERLPRWLTAVLCSTGLAGAAMALDFGPLEDALSLAVGSSLPERFEVSLSLARWLGAAVALAALLAVCARSARVGVASLLATVVLAEFAVFTFVLPLYDEPKSPRPIALEAARLTATDESVGIFDDAGLAGGILYYGNRRVDVLARPPDVARFFALGGRLVVLERWKLPWLEQVGTFEILAAAREGRRELAIVRRLAPGIQ